MSATDAQVLDSFVYFKIERWHRVRLHHLAAAQGAQQDFVHAGEGEDDQAGEGGDFAEAEEGAAIQGANAGEAAGHKRQHEANGDEQLAGADEVPGGSFPGFEGVANDLEDEGKAPR